MLFSENFEKLIQTLNRFPGIGRKTAQRLAWFMVSQDKNFALNLAETIITTVDYCTSVERLDSHLCVVENSSDIQILEGMNEYKGRYFVLGHLLSPLDGYGPEQINSQQLMERILTLHPTEIILALKPSAEGEATIHYLWELLKDKEINITRLSTGIPFGGDLEYSNLNTLSNAWKRRYIVQ